MTQPSRPLSPHLQIYRWQITQTLSIMHRMSGVVLSLAAPLLVWYLVAVASGPQAFATAQAFFTSIFGLLILIGVTAALIFHFFNGIRHLVWDTGHWFEKPQIAASGWAVVILTILGTAGLWSWLFLRGAA